MGLKKGYYRRTKYIEVCVEQSVDQSIIDILWGVSMRQSILRNQQETRQSHAPSTLSVRASRVCGIYSRAPVQRTFHLTWLSYFFNNIHRTAKIKSHLLYNSISSHRLRLKSCETAYSFVRYGPLFFNVSQFISRDAWRKRTKPNQTYPKPADSVRTHLRPDRSHCSYAWGISVWMWMGERFPNKLLCGW